jgi:hypothetical protein
MAEYAESGGGKETPEEAFGRKQQDIVRRWCAELEAARKGPYRKWMERAKKAVKRYRDEDIAQDENNRRGRKAQFNVLWSNVQTLGPAVYAKAPKAVAERRYLDRDVVARAACVVLERSLDFQIEESGFSEVMKQCRIDYLLAGLGDAWHRYEAEYEPTDPPQDDGTGGENDPGEDSADDAADADEGYEDEAPAGQPEKLVYECCKIDYTHYTDTLVSPARYWQEITWRARRAFYTRKQLRDKFGRKVGDQVPLAAKKEKDSQIGGEQREVFGKAEVWQIWDLAEREIVYICEQYHEGPLRVIDDNPLGLRGFIPSPRPVRATTTNDTVFPLPDYTCYEDQGAELDALTARIAALTKAIKVIGVHDGSFPELERLFNEGMENKTIGVKNWAKLAQTGGTNGMTGAISFLPILEMANVLTQLFAARSQVKQDLYEITGMSDIVRGASDPNETLGAQQMKGQYASVRLNDRRDEFQRFVRDNLVIMAEIICEHFSDETLWNMSDFEQWAKDQDLSAYAPPTPPMPPAMGHNGGPPLDAMPGAMPQMPPSQQAAAPVPSSLAPMGAQANGSAAAPPLATDQKPAMVPPVAAMSPGVPGQAPMAPPMPGIPIPAQPPMPELGPDGQPLPAWQSGPAGKLFQAAVALLRKDRLRSFRVDIETDSTIEPDAQAEKQARTEFITAVTQFLAQAGEMAIQMPQLMPVLGRMLLFAARGFRVGRDLESALETLVDDLEKQARNPAPKPPSPEEIKAKAEQDKMAMEAQAKQQDMAGEKQKLDMQLEAQREKMAIDREMMQDKLQFSREEMQMKRENAQLDADIAQREAAMTAQQQDRDAALAEHGAQLEHQNVEMRAAAEQESLQARGDHDERKMELAEQAAVAKAKNAAKPNAGAAK